MQLAGQPVLYTTVTPEMLGSQGLGLPVDIEETLRTLGLRTEDIEMVLGFGAGGVVTAARVQGASADEMLAQLLETQHAGVGLPEPRLLGGKEAVFLPLDSGQGWYFHASGDTIFGILADEGSAAELFTSVP